LKPQFSLVLGLFFPYFRPLDKEKTLFFKATEAQPKGCTFGVTLSDFTGEKREKVGDFPVKKALLARQLQSFPRFLSGMGFESRWAHQLLSNLYRRSTVPCIVGPAARPLKKCLGIWLEPEQRAVLTTLAQASRSVARVRRNTFIAEKTRERDIRLARMIQSQLFFNRKSK